MGQYSISPRKLDQLRRKAGRVSIDDGVIATSNDAPAPLELQWLARDRQTPLGAPFVVDVGERKAVVETFHPSGTIKHVLRSRGIDFDAEAPDGARYLQLTQGGARDTVAVSTLEGPTPEGPDQERRFQSDQAPFVFPVFAERFDDPAPFFAAVDSLYRWIMALEPFRQAGMDRQFALHGYYWQTDAQVGQFGTRDIDYDCARARQNAAVTFNGNNARAKAVLGHLMHERKYGLVLINSRVRGGAGGMASYGYPAWASITACPGETWQAVALHEIGHALGLADEYLDRNRKTELRDREPNCATASAAAPWQADMTLLPDAASAPYTLADQESLGEAGGRPVPGAEFVGLFQGARYRDDYYRPSLNCLMKRTDCLHFCTICATAVKRKLLGQD